MRRFALGLLVVVAACSGGDDDDEAEAALVDASVVAEIRVEDNSFEPATVEVAAGSTVRFDNAGRNDHNVVAAEGTPTAIEVDVADLGPGDVAERRLTEPGTYELYCSLHGTADEGMTATVVVTGGDGGELAADGTTTTAGAGSAGATDGVLEVPAEFETIQGAVDAAAPGDLVLVSPGVYEEAVIVETDELTIRGLDRDETILDGGFELENGFLVAGASGVAIENITAQNFAGNGFYWTGVVGFRGSYLTAIRNGDYGVYAFESTDGVWEHSYAAGSPDAGFYVGACYPCRIVIDDVVSEWNGLGFSGTNAGGDLYLVRSVWRDNRAGIVPNVGTYEPCYPQREATIVGNLVHGNNNGGSDAIEAAQLALGNGILLPGAIGNVVERNRVEDHDITGIGIVPFPEDDPVPLASDDFGGCAEDRVPDGLVDVEADRMPETVLWPAQDNRIVGNVVSGSGLADLGLADLGLSATPDGGNCFTGNEVGTTAPLRLQELAPCDGPPAQAGFDEGALDVGTLIARDRPPVVPYQEVDLPDPGEQPELPDAATAPPRPQVGPPSFPDLASIGVPPPR